MISVAGCTIGSLRPRCPCSGQTVSASTYVIISTVAYTLGAYRRKGETSRRRRARNLQRHFKAVLEQAGLPRNTRFHDLRHTCVTLLLRQGVHVKYVQELLGHADISLTLNVYSHVLPDMGNAAAGAIDAALG